MSSLDHSEDEKGDRPDCLLQIIFKESTSYLLPFPTCYVTEQNYAASLPH